jgi:methyl-accepting chemotaxis protein
VVAAVNEQRKLLEERLAKARSHADARQRDLLAALEERYKAYVIRLEATLEKVRQVGSNVSAGDAQRAIYEQVKASRVAADQLQSATRAYVIFTDEKVDKISAAADAEAVRAEVIMAVVAVGGILGGTALGYFVATFAIGGPLARSISNVTELAKGNLSDEIFGNGRKDEIGQIASALQVFKENALNAKRLEEEQKAAQEKQMVRAKAVEGYIAEFDRSVAGVLQMVSTASTELQSTAQSMSMTAEETSRRSTAVAAASEQASTNVQTVASAAEELSSSITEISRQVAESAKIAGQASEQARTTNLQIKGLSEAAQRIGDVVKLINDVASQTNLLALNATIEAARAGEAGKGFAVVASEVKSLANQTSKATEEISQKISEMQAATGQSVEAIGAITGTIGRINEIATTIASAVEEQGAATQ